MSAVEHPYPRVRLAERIACLVGDDVRVVEPVEAIHSFDESRQHRFVNQNTGDGSIVAKRPIHSPSASGAGVGADTRSATVGGYCRAVGDVGGAASSALIPWNLGPPTLLLALNPLENVVVANGAARKKAVHCILLVCEDFEYRI